MYFIHHIWTTNKVELCVAGVMIVAFAWGLLIRNNSK